MIKVTCTVINFGFKFLFKNEISKNVKKLCNNSNVFRKVIKFIKYKKEILFFEHCFSNC